MKYKESPVLNETLAFQNDDERIEHQKMVMSLSHAYEIEKIMNVQNVSKKDLAARIGTSASYITQIMNGNKTINLDFLARVQFALNFRIKFEYVEAENQREEFERFMDMAKEKEAKITRFPSWVTPEQSDRINMRISK